MSKFISASIGKKFLMSITGIFLMLFIMVHLSLNLLLVFDDTGELFNRGAHFMATNPVVRIIQPILAFGFLVHIAWSLIISWQNWRARPLKYGYKNQNASSTWISRNMLILGGLIAVFLVIHLMNFFWVIKFDPHSLSLTPDGREDTYSLVAGLFRTSLLYDIIYIAGAVLLGLHLIHGFWSSFQTVGFSGRSSLPGFQRIARIFAVIVAAGFASIPVYFLIRF